MDDFADHFRRVDTHGGDAPRLRWRREVIDFDWTSQPDVSDDPAGGEGISVWMVYVAAEIVVCGVIQRLRTGGCYDIRVLDSVGSADPEIVRVTAEENAEMDAILAALGVSNG